MCRPSDSAIAARTKSAADQTEDATERMCHDCSDPNYLQKAFGLQHFLMVSLIKGKPFFGRETIKGGRKNVGLFF